jgi:hypothetical protein
MMRIVLVVVAIGFSTAAFAQRPSAGGKPPTHSKPKESVGCRLVGTIKGTKLWAGDCISSTDLRPPAPADVQSPTAEPTLPNQTQRFLAPTPVNPVHGGGREIDV